MFASFQRSVQYIHRQVPSLVAGSALENPRPMHRDLNQDNIIEENITESASMIFTLSPATGEYGSARALQVTLV